MDPLATPADIEARLGRDLTDDENLRVDALIADASANVRRVSSQEFTVHEGDIITLTLSRNARARLPQRPVTAVNSVTDYNGNTLAYLRVDDELRLNVNPLNQWELEPYRCGYPTEIIVDYDHGDATIPDAIVGVVCSIVARALGTPPTQGGITQEAIDGYSYQIGSTAAAGPVGMLPSETEVCLSFKRPRAPIALMT